MIRRWTALAIAWLAMSGAAAAAELAPGNGRTLHLGGFDGTVYYTVEQDGYHVVATLASGAEATPIRFIATLGPASSNGDVLQSLFEQGVDVFRLNFSHGSQADHAERLSMLG